MARIKANLRKVEVKSALVNGEKEVKEVFRKGYKIGERVIRHAMVVVAN